MIYNLYKNTYTLYESWKQEKVCLTSRSQTSMFYWLKNKRRRNNMDTYMKREKRLLASNYVHKPPRGNMCLLLANEFLFPLYSKLRS